MPQSSPIPVYPNVPVTQAHITDVFRQYGNRLKGFISRRVRSTEDAEDILQDVFYQLVEADHLMKPIEQVSAWLYTVARNRITDWYRRKKPELLADTMTRAEDDEMVAAMEELLPEQTQTPESRYLQELVWDELEKALNQLPDEQRQAFELNEIQGIPFKEIAEQTGVPINTLISRKRYAVLHLREHLQSLYDEILNY